MGAANIHRPDLTKGRAVDITPELALQLVEWARQHAPKEMCGFLIKSRDGSWYPYPIKNVAPDPEHRFEMDPEGMVDAYNYVREFNYSFVGIYHSHPHGPEGPSELDKTYAHPGMRQWIVTKDSVHEWENTNGNHS